MQLLLQGRKGVPPSHRRPGMCVLFSQSSPAEVSDSCCFSVAATLTRLCQQPEEVYLNLVLEFVPETIYRIIKHYSRTKRQVPGLYVKVYTNPIHPTVLAAPPAHPSWSLSLLQISCWPARRTQRAHSEHYTPLCRWCGVERGEYARRHCSLGHAG